MKALSWHECKRLHINEITLIRVNTNTKRVNGYSYANARDKWKSIRHKKGSLFKKSCKVFDCPWKTLKFGQNFIHISLRFILYTDCILLQMVQCCSTACDSAAPVIHLSCRNLPSLGFYAKDCPPEETVRRERVRRWWRYGGRSSSNRDLLMMLRFCITGLWNYCPGLRNNTIIIHVIPLSWWRPPTHKLCGGTAHAHTHKCVSQSLHLLHK